MYMPQIVFIDRQGTIRAQYGGDDKFLSDEKEQDKNLRAEIETLLKEAPAHKKRAASSSLKKAP
jgi:hypothetical protein